MTYPKKKITLITNAVKEYLGATRRRALSAAYADAARDPKFLSDVEHIGRDFELGSQSCCTH